MAKHRPRAGSEDGSHPMPAPGQAPMADRVDAVVDDVQTSAGHAVVDRAMSEAKRHELCPRHDAVLARGECRNHFVNRTRGTSTPYIGVDVALVGHDADGGVASVPGDTRRVTEVHRRPQRENRPASRAVFKVAPSGRAGVRAMKGPVSGSSGGRRRFDAASPEPMRPD
jgi:hypothetical protein